MYTIILVIVLLAIVIVSVGLVKLLDIQSWVNYRDKVNQVNKINDYHTKNNSKYFINKRDY